MWYHPLVSPASVAYTILEPSTRIVQKSRADWQLCNRGIDLIIATSSVRGHSRPPNEMRWLKIEEQTCCLKRIMQILVTLVVTSSTCFIVICCLDYCQVETQAPGVAMFANIPILGSVTACSVNSQDGPRSSGNRGEAALNCSSPENKLLEVNAKKVGCSLKADRSQSFFNTLFCQSGSKDNYPLIKDKTFLSLKKIHLCSPYFVLYVLFCQWERTTGENWKMYVGMCVSRYSA